MICSHDRTMSPRVLIAVAMSLGLIGPASASAQTAPNAAPRPGSPDSGVHVSAVIFGGIGPSKFNNVDKGLQALEARYTSSGFPTVSGSMTNVAGAGHGGGGVMFSFGGSPVGVSVTGRAGNDTGPAMSALATRTAPPVSANTGSEYDHFHFIGVSIGAPINIGHAVLVEPMLDLTKWSTTNTTFENVNGVSSTIATDRSGTDPGFGLRAAWFPTHMIGFGYDLHIIKLNDVAPGLASAPWQAFLEDTQSYFSVYLRWKR